MEMDYFVRPNSIKTKRALRMVDAAIKGGSRFRRTLCSPSFACYLCHCQGPYTWNADPACDEFGVYKYSVHRAFTRFEFLTLTLLQCAEPVLADDRAFFVANG